ncbi:MAG: hypothetical protein CMG44_00170 [Candidatus Marinimicrobia bacterium]|nr:hypothetical protein [Candidatus Neomarinimicrobiota bacterium]|tara:strand:+ start:140 stop:817 length:678 start_codon:yes stop_codon:yes gene_type:complete
MLKPKRKITRDEIKKDSFVESVFMIRSYINDNFQLLGRIGGGVALIIIIMIFLSQSFQNNRQEAEYLLTKSTLYLDSGDLQNAKIQLQELIDEYGSTESGKIGAFYLAQIYLSDNNHESAISLFQTYAKKGNNPFLLTSSNEALSNLYLEKDDFKNAIKYQLKAVEYSDTKRVKALNSLKLCELYLKNNDVEKSTKILNDIRNNYTDDVEIIEKIDYIYGVMMKK